MDELARGDRHGSARVPDEERPLRGPPRGVPHRRREDRLEGARRAPQDLRPVDPPGRRRRRRGLVQHRGTRAPRDRHDPPRRLGRGRARPPGPGDGLADDGRASSRAEELGLPLDKVSVADRRHAAALRPGLGRLDDDALERSDDPRARPSRPSASSPRRSPATWNVSADSVDRRAAASSRRREIRRTRISWAEACAKLPAEEGVSATADRAENHDDAWKRFTTGAQFAEVEVDIETGKVRVERVVAVHDCGVPINPLADESQIQGGVIQGMSYALFEDRVLDRQTGRMVNPNVETLQDRRRPRRARDRRHARLRLGRGQQHATRSASASRRPWRRPRPSPTPSRTRSGRGSSRLPITPEVVLAAVHEARHEGRPGHETLRPRSPDLASTRPRASRCRPTASSRPEASTSSTG